ncbi:hypothetical protein E1212_27685 [Jiangella ureilytica]|uniref:Uncharacterized protein n=1 Tax=Jiangella ureilytica TaxID=2530374 RepID=A0A4R4RAK7_9ACTN|nr:DUF6463 family protein [Jiangella ureilytica]TDC46096.1 hypothetical protein E1212_27685 [Jiangella ureilytica]
MTRSTHPEVAVAADPRPVRHRPVVGWSLLAIAAGHVLAAPLVYPDSLRSTWEGGVLLAVEGDPSLIAERGIGFWYVTAGLGVGLLGGVVRWAERRTGPVPRGLGWALLGLTLWGVALMPKSGFWAFAVPAALILRRPRGGAR